MRVAVAACVGAFSNTRGLRRAFEKSSRVGSARAFSRARPNALAAIGRAWASTTRKTGKISKLQWTLLYSDENSKVSPSPKSPMEWGTATARNNGILEGTSMDVVVHGSFLTLPPSTALSSTTKKTSGVLEGHTDDGRRRYESGSKGEGGREGWRWRADGRLYK